MSKAKLARRNEEATQRNKLCLELETDCIAYYRENVHAVANGVFLRQAFKAGQKLEKQRAKRDSK